MKTPIIARLESIRKRNNLSFEDAAERSGFSTSTLRRWWKGESIPSVEDVENLAEAMGGTAEEVFAAVGKQEMIETQTIGYQGAAVMSAQYEERLKAKDEKYNLLKEHHDQRIAEIHDQHARSVQYLKEEILRLRGELDLANQAAVELASSSSSFAKKKYIVFWVLAGADLILAALLLVALRTGPIF